jgi:hypothetical protein
MAVVIVNQIRFSGQWPEDHCGQKAQHNNSTGYVTRQQD